MKKIIITIVLTFIVSIIAGAISSILFYAPAQLEMNNLFPEAVPAIPNMEFMVSGGLALVIFWVICFDKMGINKIKSGAITGLWFAVLIFAFFDFTLLGISNLFSLKFALIDIGLSAIIGCVLGAVIGWSLGRFS